ncbi:MAG: NUDIX domain-containing protein [Rhodobacteraceae bacterium]|nr:NUDIX domain-containing protein [Paracoccaceae bacterium]
MPLPLAAGAEPVCMQVAGLCWRAVDDRVEVLLITSRDTGRWIIPKGWPMKGLSDAAAALREAYEEAGVQGAVVSDPVGHFHYVKVMDAEHGLPCGVAVYAIRVKQLREKFPENDQRQRKWFAPARAALKVDEPELRALLRRFDPLGLAPRDAG